LILDSSAIVSLLTEEIGHESIARRAVAGSGNADTREKVIPFTAEHYDAAVDAFERFGKGRHPAALNFGDCLTCAVARLSGLPLLYTGEDFARTDLAVYST
jgi:ribonuclease VapC